MTIDPNNLTEKEEIRIGVKKSAPATQNTFNTFFKEPVATFSCAQKGTYGGTVEIEIMPDQLNNIDTSKPMYVYSYNPATNSYKRYDEQAVLLEDGRIKCTVDRGYDIVVSNSDSFTGR